MKRTLLTAVIVTLLLGGACLAQTMPGLAALEEEIERAIHNDEIPGAVLLIGHKGQVVHRKAYGNRALAPQVELMTVDTIFDCASLQVCPARSCRLPSRRSAATSRTAPRTRASSRRSPDD